MRIPAIIILTVFCLFMACDRATQKGVLAVSKEAELKTYFTAKVKEADSTWKLDTFRLIRIDTLTHRDLYATMIVNVSREMKTLTGEMQEILDELKYNYRQANLVNGLSSTLYNNYKSEAEDNQEKMKEKQFEATLLQNKYDSIQNLYKSCDSITPLNYEAVFLFQIRKKDMSVQKDTGFILMNQDLNIIERSSYGTIN